MSKVSNVWVFSDSANRLEEVMGGARELGEKVICFVVGDDAAKRAFEFGADEVYKLPSDAVSENFALSISKIIESQNGLVLMPNTRRCKAMASLIGANLKAGVSTEVNEINLDNASVVCKRMVYGGLAIGTERINSAVAIVVVNSGAFAPAVSNFDGNKEAKTLEFIEPKAMIKCIKKLPKQASSIDLNKAKRIVAIGRGIAKEEDIAIARELCEILGAELGCSRPIAEGEKWMEHERYIGISSVMPKPEIYISIGISGQIQHMVGVKDAGKIIVINKDKNAPIFDYADFGIVGDLYKVVPALINSLK